MGLALQPHAAKRQLAIDRTAESLALAKEIDADFCVVWPGIDGYENPFGIDMAGMRHRFASGLAEALDREPGMPIAFEPSPTSRAGASSTG